MNWIDYKKLAARTEAIPTIYYANLATGMEGEDAERMQKATRLLHATIGMCTEAQELVDTTGAKNTKEELGDCYWYLPIVHACCPGLEDYCAPTQKRQSYEAAVAAMQRYASEALDTVAKRHIFYGKPLDEARLIEAVYQYTQALECAIAFLGITKEECLEANIAKLEKRFPALRFDSDHAVNRDVDHELSHISDAAPATLFQQLVTTGITLSAGEAQDAGIYPGQGMARMRRKLRDFMGPLTAGQVEQLQNSELHVSQEEDGTVKVYIQLVEPAPTNASLELFSEIVYNELTQTEALNKIGTWAITMTERCRASGANALAEGYKTAYVKVMEAQKLEKVIKDGFFLFTQVYGEVDRDTMFERIVE